MKRWMRVITAICLIICMLPLTINAEASTTAEPVTVYFSMSHDEDFRDGADTGEVMALREITVPYFDLGLYDLQEFYFVSEEYGDDGDGQPGSDLEAGTKEFAEGKITMFHLFIYATEVYYCGIDPEKAGQGYLADEGLIGSEVMQLSGSRGSIFFEQFWGRDLNFNYYHNYNYPLASDGWGSTADQILLHDGDVVTMGHFTDWNFFKDPDSIFNYIKAGDTIVKTSVTQGEQLELTIWRAGASEDGDYQTAHEIVTKKPEVYIISQDQLDADISNWNSIGNADANGKITLETAQLEPGRYVVAVPGQYGSENTKAICSTPGAILVDVLQKEETDDVLLGDMDGDGKVNASDASFIYAIVNNKLTATETQMTAADIDGNSTVNASDAALVYASVNGKLN